MVYMIGIFENCIVWHMSHAQYYICIFHCNWQMRTFSKGKWIGAEIPAQNILLKDYLELLIFEETADVGEALKKSVEVTLLYDKFTRTRKISIYKLSPSPYHEKEEY